LITLLWFSSRSTSDHSILCYHETLCEYRSLIMLHCEITESVCFLGTLTSREPRHSRLPHVPPGLGFAHPDQRLKRKCITFIPDGMDAERSPIQSTLYCAEVGIKDWAVRPENAIYTRTQGLYVFVQRPQWMYLSIKPSACVIVTDSVQLAPRTTPNSQFSQVPNYRACATFPTPQLGTKIRH
jgi:hypothetical protein